LRRGIKPNSKQSYLSVLEDLREQYGKDLIVDVRGKHIKAIMAAKADAVAKDDPDNPHAGKAAAKPHPEDVQGAVRARPGGGTDRGRSDRPRQEVPVQDPRPHPLGGRARRAVSRPASGRHARPARPG